MEETPMVWPCYEGAPVCRRQYCKVLLKEGEWEAKKTVVM